MAASAGNSITASWQIAAKRINVAFSGFDAYEVAPQKLPDLMARRPLILFGKYRGTAGGRIEVRLDCIGENVRLRITDSGQGINPAFLPHVFDRFRQADSTSTRGGRFPQSPAVRYSRIRSPHDPIAARSFDNGFNSVSRALPSANG